MNQNYVKNRRSIEWFWTDPNWLRDRMLFVSGPRQVGKTTLINNTLCPNQKGYFNWDDRKTRSAYQKDPAFFSDVDHDWICFDEIHKRPKWKDILKGVYDTFKNEFHFVITGSARLETFKRSGDSLVGRYFHTHLFPLNIPDFEKNDFEWPDSFSCLVERAADLEDAKALENLLMFGGYPEPFYAASENFWERWSNQHNDLIIQEDLRDLTRIQDFDKVENLLDMLNPSIGQNLNYSHLARDLETTHNSVKRWLQTLYRVHLVFSLSPYSKNIRRSYKLEKKWYFSDWRASQNNRFENYIAASLQRALTLYHDRYGKKTSLHYIRTTDGTEIDFALCENGKPFALIEAKEGFPEISRAMYRFTNELKVPGVVVTKKKNFFKKTKGKEGQIIYQISWGKLARLLP